MNIEFSKYIEDLFSQWFDDENPVPETTKVERRFEDKYVDFMQRLQSGDDCEKVTQSLHEFALARASASIQAESLGYLQTSIHELAKAVKELKDSLCQ